MKKGKRFSKLVENFVGKGEIARYEQFLFFPQCFRKLYTAVKTQVCLGNLHTKDI